MSPLSSAPHGFKGVFRTDDVARAVYSEAAGVARIIPNAVAVPADAEDIVVLMGWAAASGQSLVMRGSGSSMAGGAVGPGVVVDLGRLDTFGAVQIPERRLVVGPAVTRDRVEVAAMRGELVFPVDPSSGAFATIGGMCATNAAGARAVKYGAMRRWVAGVECIFADGTRAWLRRGTPAPELPALQRFLTDVAPRVRSLGAAALTHALVRKESSGYGLAAWLASGDLLDLIIGSEGTLACIVGVELVLTPLPESTASLVAGFPDLEGAAAAAGQLAVAGASAVELLDRSFLEIAAGTGEPLPIAIPPGLEAVLVIEVEAASDELAARGIADLVGWCEAGGATFISRAFEPHEETKLWKLRHAASPILSRLAPRLQSLQIVEDGCVPPARFAEYVIGVRRSLADAHFRGVIFGHAGDGHAHVNVLLDVHEADWRVRVERLLVDVTELVSRLGGTLTAEHGDGRLRAPLLPRVWSPEALDLFAATKRAFDPAGILNPGVKVPAPAARALDQVKYDPALPALPGPARAALDLVVREKAWARHRLDLIQGDR